MEFHHRVEGDGRKLMAARTEVIVRNIVEVGEEVLKGMLSNRIRLNPWKGAGPVTLKSASVEALSPIFLMSVFSNLVHCLKEFGGKELIEVEEFVNGHCNPPAVIILLTKWLYRATNPAVNSELPKLNIDLPCKLLRLSHSERLSVRNVDPEPKVEAPVALAL
jgi:hypothetical protein